MLLVTSTLAAIASIAVAQATCGTLTLEGGGTQTIWRDACYNIRAKVISAQVLASCDCDFSK